MRGTLKLFAGSLLIIAALCAATYALWNLRATKLAFFPAVDDRELRSLFEKAEIRALEPPPPEALALIELGRMLFFDKILSGNKNISCATCHNPRLATTDGLSLSLGEGARGSGTERFKSSARLTPRNSPALFNLGYAEIDTLFWDGRVRRDSVTGEVTTPDRSLRGPHPRSLQIAKTIDSTVALQALFPVTSPTEMAGVEGRNEISSAPNRPAIWARLMIRLIGDATASQPGIAEYRLLFKKAYPEVAEKDLNFAHATNALAAFMRQSFIAIHTPLDEYLRGKSEALDVESKIGAKLFLTKGQCTGCHRGPLLSSHGFASLAFPQMGPGKASDDSEPKDTHISGFSLSTLDDFGRYLVTRSLADKYKFRIPSLRNVALTGPWGHAGTFFTLDSVVQHILSPKDSLERFIEGNIQRKEFKTNLTQNKKYNEARLKAFSAPQISLTPEERASVVHFLETALTDRASIELAQKAIPGRVPSGLPVED